MEEEDLEILRNEYYADPQRYQHWDSNLQFRREYLERHSRDPSYQEVVSRATSCQTSGKEDVSGHVTPEPAKIKSPSLSSSIYSSGLCLDQTPTSARHKAYSKQIPPIRGLNVRRSTGASAMSMSRRPTQIDPEMMRRIRTLESQQLFTVGTASEHGRLQKEKSIPPMGGDKPYPPPLPDQDDYVVEYDGVDDPLHGQNWPVKKKLFISAILTYDALCATVGSSIFSAAIGPVSQEFGVGTEVGTLGTSLFVFGYAFGPLIWAPMSELCGRKPPILIGSFGFAVFSIAVAVGKDIQTILICRFFAGMFGSCPLACVAAVFTDIYDNSKRGLSIAVFSVGVFMGPLLAPFIGGFITDSYLGWRWTQYISSIMGWLDFILLALFMEETYPPVVLVSKAAELRRKTKNWGIHAKQEEIEVDFKELVIRNVSRPMRILFTEPIVFLVTLYMSFIYGLLYLLLTAYALVFEGQYHWNRGQEGLAYFGLIAGELTAFAFICVSNASYVRKLKANNDIPVPEWRLPVAMIGGILFSGGLFWFGWTGYSGRILWVAPVFSGVFTGFGLFSIFLSLLNYIVDSYLMFAASALAGNNFMRCLFGGVFPLFAQYMFKGMGIQWGSTLLGCVAFVAIPMPFVFYRYGKKIRNRSKFAPAPDIEQDKKRDEEANLDSGFEGRVDSVTGVDRSGS